MSDETIMFKITSLKFKHKKKEGISMDWIWIPTSGLCPFFYLRLRDQQDNKQTQVHIDFSKQRIIKLLLASHYKIRLKGYLPWSQKTNC